MKIMKFNLISVLVISIVFSVSASSWFTAWIGLELNSMVFIPLMMSSKNQQMMESTMKYFLIQALSSTLLLFFSLNLINPMTNFLEISLSAMLVSIFMKIGASPFLVWYLDLLNKINWSSMKMILTLQKIAPLTLCSFMLTNKNYLMVLFSVSSSAVLGSFLGLKQTSVKKIIASSSVTHMAWMITSIMINISVFFTFMVIYILIIMPVLISLEKMKIKTMSQVMMSSNSMLSLNILSLGGLPPLPGFLLKWMILQELMKMNMKIIPVVLVSSSLMSLYFYFRLTIMSFFLKLIKMKWFHSCKTHSLFMNIMFVVAPMISFPMLI